MIQRAQAPWLSSEIRSAKRLRRIAKCNWRSTKCESDRRTFKLLRNKAVFLMNKSCCEFYKDFISNISGDLFPSLQSAYRQHDSTESALLKVKNDILMNMEDQHVMLLVLLHLSATFDTVDHRILLDCLQFDFGISGSAPNWFESFLSNRTQRISIDGILSNIFNHKFGVPQGSCLRPLLFSLYASKLFKIVESHLPNLHCYVGDTRLYIAFRPGNDLD